MIKKVTHIIRALVAKLLGSITPTKKSSDLFFVTGTSGSGKSTMVIELKKHLNNAMYAVHDFDELGVPPSADEAWRMLTTAHWVKKGNDNAASHKQTIICGVVVPTEVIASVCTPPSAHFIFLKIADDTIRQRLQNRGWSNQQIEDNCIWARYLEQDTLKHGGTVIATDGLTPQQVAAKIKQIIAQ